jgi:hypothetical protein
MPTVLAVSAGSGASIRWFPGGESDGAASSDGQLGGAAHSGDFTAGQVAEEIAQHLLQFLQALTLSLISG